MTEFVTVQTADLAKLLDWVKNMAETVHEQGLLESPEFGPRTTRLQRAVDRAQS